MEIKYKPVIETSIEEIPDQIRLRYNLIQNVLVGSLYPAILEGEIEELRKIARR
jgi:hypothetical protein